MNARKAQFSFAHFDTSSIALPCCLTELWVLEWAMGDFKVDDTPNGRSPRKD